MTVVACNAFPYVDLGHRLLLGFREAGKTLSAPGGCAPSQELKLFLSDANYERVKKVVTWLSLFQRSYN